ncbi:RNA-binding S4 domain-containing protein [Paracoccus suum]|uniref:RNA-binding S4 domain-containing protein n=1 Tax=Paracoccus suum TaxID=2259340 RepID=A0A344PK73_9RHOB|nr:RNA-binding S4 domain-containing protein [Paracoccus suum]AXC49778.1 RNA-binding S4 domain-containing protein [Paracoccus suum]
MNGGPHSADHGDGPGGRIRLDRWLFHVRAFKTRTLAADRIAGGGIRVNGTPCGKPAHLVGPGDVVTIGSAARVRVLRFLAPGERRGPPDEANLLYEDLSEG